MLEPNPCCCSCHRITQWLQHLICQFCKTLRTSKGPYIVFVAAQIQLLQRAVSVKFMRRTSWMCRFAFPVCPALHMNWTPETFFRISSSFHCCTYFQKSKKHNKVVYLISQQNVLWSAYPGYSSVSYSGTHSPHVCVFWFIYQTKLSSCRRHTMRRLMLAFYLSAAADLICFWMFAFLSLYINL